MALVTVREVNELQETISRRYNHPLEERWVLENKGNEEVKEVWDK